jgi:2-keto-3-deoxy-L-fuconate dehydrogenase
MPGRLEGKRVLVTAAGAGIGYAIAAAAAAAGAAVIATDLKPATVPTGPRLTARALDVRDDEAVRALVADIGTVDCLINVAGMVPHGTVLDSDDATWSLAVDLNVIAMARMVRAVLPGMLAHGGGAVVAIASVCSSIRGFPNRAVYGATKGAVIGLTRSIAADFVARGIRANAICPGTVDTPSLQQRIAEQAASRGVAADTVLKEFVGRQPMGRLGLPEEVAEMAVYLASDAARFVTGQEFIIDGGITA